ncbi:hypothetical protein CBS101457_001641 [Exobasidium rhododendri]|nr:hypothetical protein CBS101457_001641 [Exobasidium rhododendri]
MPAVASPTSYASSPTTPAASQKKFNTVAGFQWRRFMRVGSEEAGGAPVERRVRKVRSDLTQRVKPLPRPVNNNVGGTTSQSDVGEDSIKTDDDRSMSGQSTSNSYPRSDRPDVPSRSTSVDTDRAQRDNFESMRKSANFAGIPEEMERERMPSKEVDQGGNEADVTAVTKRERKHRRHLRKDADKVTVNDFDMIRVLGKGCAGKVLLVRHLPTKGLFAMKSIHKRHVLAHQELQHTLTEQAVLKRMAKEVMDPFVVKLWWSFHDKSNLYLVMDFHPGGDLATQLSRWGRLGRDRARFYAAEIVEGVEGLHQAGVIYRDLKPENVLIGSDGHIVLSDFGLSKEFPVRDGEQSRSSSTPPPESPSRSQSSKETKNQSPHHDQSTSEDNRSGGSTSRDSSGFGDTQSTKAGRSRWTDERDMTTTFCGTAEYLAPEVIQGAAYSYEVDWWSFGTMLYEMLTGITPFWADTHADMYVRVLHDELVFPDDRVLDQDTKSILRGLLQRNPMLRMKEPRIKKHPYFSMIEWAHVYHKRYIPPYIPPINPLDETDTQNFDEAFLDMQPVVNGAEDALPDVDDADADMTAISANSKAQNAADAKGPGVPFGSGDAGQVKETGDNKSLFDGYSFRGRKDSESVKSSIFSFSAGEDDQKGVVVVDEALQLGTGTASSASAVPSVHRAALTSTPVAATRSATEENEDDDSAAMAAVVALDQLEREAANDELMSSPSMVSTSTRPTSSNTIDTPGDGGIFHFHSALSKARATGTSAISGLPLHGIIAEKEEEGDEDWDMVDAPSAGEVVQSETNGGKGQNLFSRGVVDTYRLIRRQDTNRVPTSPSYSSGTMNKPFNRLTRKNRNSRRDLRTNEQRGNGSAVSLGNRSGSRNENESSGNNDNRVSEEDSQDNSEKKTRLGGLSPLPSFRLTPVLTSGEDTPTSQRGKKAASPSLDSSEDIASQERNKQRLKKTKRFTRWVL